MWKVFLHYSLHSKFKKKKIKKTFCFKGLDTEEIILVKPKKELGRGNN